MKLTLYFPLILFGLFFATGFGMLAFALRNAWQSTRASAWPVTPAVIKALEVRKNDGGDTPTYHVDVAYSYTVNGVTYHGSRLAFGYSGSSSPKLHYDLCKMLQNAKAIDARYDPADPASSCLSCGIHGSIQLALIFAVTWLLFTTGLTLFFLLVSRADTVLLDNLSIQ